MRDYLMRHDKSLCMTLETVLPEANNVLFRYALGRLVPPKVTFLKSLRDAHAREVSVRTQIYQDLAFPAAKFEEMLGFVHDTTGIYPLLLYSSLVVDRGGMLRVPSGVEELPTGFGSAVHGHACRKTHFMNLGVYGVPVGIRQSQHRHHDAPGRPKFKTLHAVRALEAKVRELGGFQHTYCDSTQTREDLEQMFDFELWRRMRTEYGASGFPHVHDKVKPEVDVQGWLREEAAW